MEGGCTKAKKIKKEKSMERKGDAPIWMAKEWRLRERSIGKKKVRQKMKGKEKSGIGDREAGQEWEEWMERARRM